MSQWQDGTMKDGNKCTIVLLLVVLPSDLMSGGQVFLVGGRRFPRSLLLASTGPFSPTAPFPGGLPPRSQLTRALIFGASVTVNQSCVRPRSGCLAAGPPALSRRRVRPLLALLRWRLYFMPHPASLFAPGFNEGSRDLKRVAIRPDFLCHYEIAKLLL